LCAGGAE
jgi:transcriptional regulator NrdR family protein